MNRPEPPIDDAVAHAVAAIDKAIKHIRAALANARPGDPANVEYVCNRLGNSHAALLTTREHLLGVAYEVSGKRVLQ